MVEEKVKLLAKASWSAKDIAKYVECSENKARKIMKIAIKDFNGRLKYEISAVRVDAIMNYLGTTREREIFIIQEIMKMESK